MKSDSPSDHPENVAGAWSVDMRCIRCDAARHWAPGLVRQDDEGRSFVARQPLGDEEEQALWRAAVACPTQSIHRLGKRRPPRSVFPHELAPGVLALGHNARSAFGAHSFLVRREEGNVLTDSPRYQPGLVEQVEALGGIAHIVLGHRDDVADADRWAERFGARVWIHEADADAAPYATDVIQENPTEILSNVVARHAPGHTEGHLVLHVDDRWLFTGDTLHWNPRRQELDVTPKQTWHSWEALTSTITMLGKLSVEGIFPTHGMWCRLDRQIYVAQMTALAAGMRSAGQEAWSHRPGTTFGWY